MLDVSDYLSKHCEIEYLSDLCDSEGEALIGKTIAKIIAHEYMLILEFADGSSLEVTGGRWDGCSLGVELQERKDA